MTLSGIILESAWPRWAVMWVIAIVIFSIAKSISWLPASKIATTSGRIAAYFLAWPGLDAASFLKLGPAGPSPSISEWLFAGAKVAFGISLLAIGVAEVDSANLMLAGWIGMIGIVFTLHFGAFHLLSCFWRSRGVPASPLMDWPILSQSVSEFWGKRWNRAFRDLTHRFVFRPLTGRFGLVVGSLLAFLFSGLIHELAITVPAGAGYGGRDSFFRVRLS
jgi:hypothetical protein